jgi:hypothetical protein
MDAEGAKKGIMRQAEIEEEASKVLVRASWSAGQL